MTAIDTHAEHEHPPFLAHHWETPQQQFEAGKLGMWLFLATEFLLFGGLFCAYAVYRHNHPEIFHYGSRFLDTKWGAINTVVLILSSLTMALGVSAAQLGRTRALIVLLSLTFLGGAIFMGIKYVEYKHKIEHHILWGTTLYVPSEHDEPPAHATSHEAGTKTAANEIAATPAHAAPPAGQATPTTAGDGSATSMSLESGTDAHASEATPPDAAHATGTPATGTPATGAPATGTPATGTPAPGAPAPGGPAAAATPPASILMVLDGVEITKSDVPPAAAGPSGLSSPRGPIDGHDASAEEAAHAEPNPRTDPTRPANAHIFFGIYFCMTGLHGVHVLIGMAVIGWLIFRSARGEFSSAYFTPVDLGGLYWHVVDLIWIFLFPLLYLIG